MGLDQRPAEPCTYTHDYEYSNGSSTGLGRAGTSPSAARPPRAVPPRQGGRRLPRAPVKPVFYVC